MSVNNHVVVAPPVRTDHDVKADLKSAFIRRLPFDEIDVSVDKGFVILQGNVPT